MEIEAVTPEGDPIDTNSAEIDATLAAVRPTASTSSPSALLDSLFQHGVYNLRLTGADSATARGAGEER